MCYISARVLDAVELILLVAVGCKILHYDDVKYVYYSRTKVTNIFFYGILIWFLKQVNSFMYRCRQIGLRSGYPCAPRP
jgi:hypothetical protein